MKITWRGDTYDLDLLEVTLKQAEQICLFCGCQTLEEWEKQLFSSSASPVWPKAVTAAYWLMVTQSGTDAGRLSDADIAFLKFGQAFAEAAAAEAGDAGEDPTTAAAPTGGTSTGTTIGSAGSGPGTSPTSAAPTFSDSPGTAPVTPSSSTS